MTELRCGGLTKGDGGICLGPCFENRLTLHEVLKGPRPQSLVQKGKSITTPVNQVSC